MRAHPPLMHLNWLGNRFLIEFLGKIDGRVADVLRIISARKANAKKVQQYENH